MANKSIEEFTRPIDFGKNFKLFYIEEIDILVGESLHSNQRNSIREVGNGALIGEFELNKLKIKGANIFRDEIQFNCAKSEFPSNKSTLRILGPFILGEKYSGWQNYQN